MEENKTPETIRVLFLPAGKKAEMGEIEPTLSSMQDLVGGMIEEYHGQNGCSLIPQG